METQSTEVQTMETDARPKSRKGLIVGGLVGLALLVGAAFVGGRLLNQEPTASGPGGALIAGGPDGAGGQAIQLQIENAKELPQAPPDVTGVYSRREDNSIFVKSGDGSFMVTVDESGKVNADTGGNAQEVEVVVTGDTVVYKDVTQSQFDNPPSGGTIQQKVEPGSVDEIGDNSFVTAWGERRGDRLIASVVLYSQPMIFSAPGGAP